MLLNKVFKNPYKNGGLSGYHHENKTTSTNRWELTVVSLWFSNRFEHAEKTGLNRSFFSAVSPMKTKAKTPVFEAKKTGPHRLPKIETVLRVPQYRNTGNETGGWWDLTSDKSTFKNNTKGLAQYSIYLRALNALISVLLALSLAGDFSRLAEQTRSRQTTRARAGLRQVNGLRFNPVQAGPNRPSKVVQSSPQRTCLTCHVENSGGSL